MPGVGFVCDTARVRLVDWLDTVPLSDPGGDDHAGSDEELALATAILDHGAIDLGERIRAVPESALPINLAHRTLASIHRCEQLATSEITDADPAPDTWEMFRGKALDAYVCHVIHAGAVADPVEDLRSHWIAKDLPLEVESLDHHLGVGGLRVEGQEVNRRVGDLSALAASAGAFSQLRDLFPRVEVTLAWTAAGVVRLPGRIDVLLGGPGTPLPAVLVEVKSGVHRADHAAQLRHYLMIAALTHHRMPAAAALWYPGAEATDTAETCIDVPTEGTVASSAKRAAGAMERLGELWDGRVPRRTAGSHCNWCPESDSCEQALELVAGLERAGG